MEIESIKPFNLSYKEFTVICRICLNKGELSEFEKSDLLNLFQNITDIRIEQEDDLPKNVCSSCIHKLENIFSFITSSKCNDAYLRQILNNAKEISVEDTFFESDVADDTAESLNYSDDDKLNIKYENCNSELEICDNIKNKSSLNPNASKPIYKKSMKHSTKRQPSECEICGESFSTKSKLNEHQKKNSNCRTRQYKCMHCDMAFFTKFRLKLHMRSHTKETPFECKICFKKFRHSSNLKRHDDIVHKGLKPFKCDVCGKEYSRRATRNEHMYSHTGERPYVCVYCGKRFRTNSNHFSHVYCHRIANGEIPESDIKAKRENLTSTNLECSICNKRYSSKSAIFQHLQLHGEKPFLCSICGKSFLRKRQLEDHSKMHTGEKPHTCKYCGKRFRLTSGYKNHILVHTGEKPYQCKMCQKSFVQSVHLTKHMRIHTGEKPYRCSFCDKTFAQNCNLKVHTRIHTGETPYRCSICGIGFHDSSNMKKHKKGHRDSDPNLVIKKDTTGMLK